MRTLLIATGVALAAQMSIAYADEAEAKKETPAAEMKKEDAAAEMEKKDAAAEEMKADVEVTIEGHDNMQFDKKEFTVKEGEVVALTFKNAGTLPKAAMGHNIMILKEGTVVPAFAVDCAPNGQTTGLPVNPELQEKIVAHTDILGPGEEETVTFTAPAAGTYDYICTFPGHFALMKGVMTVEAK